MRDILDKLSLDQDTPSDSTTNHSESVSGMFGIESSAQLIQPGLFELGSHSLREGVADCHNALLARRFG